MKTLVALLTLALLGTSVCAQNTSRQKLINKLKSTNPKVEIDLNAEPSGAPTDELTVDEFRLERKDLTGQVVELEFDRVIGLKQSGKGYTAQVTFDDVRGQNGVTLLIPEEGLELFEKLAERDVRSRLRTKVYVEVLPSKALLALGERYSKKDPEGERYSW